MKPRLFVALLWAASAQAHEVHTRVETTDAVVVTLAYANGQPFAYEKYALTPAGEATPRQVGNTDAQGRIAFVPGATRSWRLQAASADGHGVSMEISVPATGERAAAQEPVPRWLLAGCGLALLFGLFGLVQLFARKKT